METSKLSKLATKLKFNSSIVIFCLPSGVYVNILGSVYSVWSPDSGVLLVSISAAGGVGRYEGGSAGHYWATDRRLRCRLVTLVLL